MKTYALTVKKTRKPITLDAYEDYLTWLATKCEVGNVNYEDTRGLHFHCVLNTPDDFKYEDLKIVPYGWSFKLVPIFNMQGWLKYSQKDADKKVKENLQMADLYEHAPSWFTAWPPECSEHEVAPKGEPSVEEEIDTNALHKPDVILPEFEPSPMDLYKNGLDIRKNYKK